MGHSNYVGKQIILKNFRVFTFLSEFIYNYSDSSIIPLCISTCLPYIGVSLFCFVFKSQTILWLNIWYLQDCIIKTILHESQGKDELWPVQAAWVDSLLWLTRLLFLSWSGQTNWIWQDNPNQFVHVAPHCQVYLTQEPLIVKLRWQTSSASCIRLTSPATRALLTANGKLRERTVAWKVM